MSKSARSSAPANLGRVIGVTDWQARLLLAANNRPRAATGLIGTSNSIRARQAAAPLVTAGYLAESAAPGGNPRFAITPLGRALAVHLGEFSRRLLEAQP